MTTMQLSQPDSLTREERKVLDQMLDKTKGRLFFQKNTGFLGSLLCNHEFIWDFSAPTAWCNGKTIAFNPHFFLNVLDKDTRVFVLAHELWHTGFSHMLRLNDHDPEVWNQAADYVINIMLEKEGYKTDVPLCPPLLDPKYDGMSTEQVYDILIKEKQQKGGGGSSPSGSGAGQPVFGGDDLKAPPEGEAQEVMLKVIQAKQAAQMSGDAGSIPGEVELLISDFLDPILPWEKLLARFFTDLSKDDYSWRRPSRRYEDEYLPSLMGENGLEHLCYYLDISGSVSDEDITRFNSEVCHIHRTLCPKRLTLVTFDTQIQDVYDFADDDRFDAIKVIGRGGTSLKPVYEHIVKNKPTAAVVFSDLYCQEMQADPGVPVLWVVIGNQGVSVPFGKEIHIDSE